MDVEGGVWCWYYYYYDNDQHQCPTAIVVPPGVTHHPLQCAHQRQWKRTAMGIETLPFVRCSLSVRVYMVSCDWQFIVHRIETDNNGRLTSMQIIMSCIVFNSSQSYNFSAYIIVCSLIKVLIND